METMIMMMMMMMMIIIIIIIIMLPTPHSEKLSAYVPPSVWATKFHTYTKQLAKL